MTQNNQRIRYDRELEIRYRPDVLIAGGGPAGIAAALAARRQGVSVRLVEAHSCLGGMGTAGMVPAFMTFSDGTNFLAGGIGREVLDALRSAEGTVPVDGKGIRAEVLKRVYDQMLIDEGVRFAFHTHLVDVVETEGHVHQAICTGKSGMFAIEAKAYVDCTGDGDLSVFAGATFEKGDAEGSMMPGTLCSLWGGVDWKTIRESGLGTGNSRIEDAFRDGVFTLEDRHLPGMWRVGDAIGGGNIGHTFGLDGTCEESLTRAYIWGRKSLREYEQYYKTYLKGFESMELVATGSLMGVRESRRIVGDYVLNIDDFDPKSTFDDEIGRYSYPIDIHIAKPDKESYDKFYKEFTSLRLGKGESYAIPYRILTPAKLTNVLVAGRCVSTDRNMQASIRVMPGCYITGQAAGIAATMAVAEGKSVHDIDVGELQSKLIAMGAFLPNASR
jgi:hypothetical protein